MALLTCHDCGKEIISSPISFKVGFSVAEYTGTVNEFFKCQDCYKTDPILRNFQECEVYSRIVGYIRPVKNWNESKRTEFGDRKVFGIKEEEKLKEESLQEEKCSNGVCRMRN